MGLLRVWSLGRGQKVPYSCLVTLKMVPTGQTDILPPRLPHPMPSWYRKMAKKT